MKTSAVTLACVSLVLLTSTCARPPRSIVSDPPRQAMADAPAPARALPSARAPGSEHPSASPPSDASAHFAPVPGFAGAVVVRGLPAVVRVTTLFAQDPVEPEAMTAACALTKEGAEWCWRYRGEPEPDGLPDLPPWPMAIDTFERVREVSGTYALTSGIRSLLESGPESGIADARALANDGAGCVIRRNGRVACWYAIAPWDDASAHAEVPLVHDATEVAIGRFGGCAVEKPGTLACWGAASLTGWDPGGSGWTPPPPTHATVLRGIIDVAHVSLRGEIPCLIRHNGRVVCWFPEDAATLLPQNPLPADGVVRDIDDAVALSGQLVVHASGALSTVVWDIDDAGRTRMSSRIVGGGVLTDVVSVDGSANSGCAVRRSGVVVCWGIGGASP